MQTENDGTIQMGKHIAVIDNGFVHVGDCSLTGPVHGHAGFLVMQNAKNIRNYGTERGIGQLAGGPTEKTQSDPLGYVLVPFSRVTFLIKVTGGW